jgi:DNA gyrase subunit A
VHEDTDAQEDEEGETVLTTERYAQLGAEEQFILTVSENGFGKRSSAYEYRISGRGGKGIIGMSVTERNGPIIAAFPVEDTDQLMLVTDSGSLIRTSVGDVRVAGRNTQGVTIFRTEEDARVVSVVRIGETSSDDEDSDDDNGDDNGSDAMPDETSAGADESTSHSDGQSEGQEDGGSIEE